MSTWSGWEIAFTTAAGVINPQPVQRFMNEWANHANSPSCGRNPIDLHHPVGNSTNCVQPAGFSWYTQNYTSHADAATAFSRQLNSNAFAAILDTIGTGDPFQDTGYKDVARALRAWGSTNFADWYEAQAKKAQGGGGGGSGRSARAHHGWKDVRHSVNHNMPKTLREDERNVRAALRSLSQARRVKL